ncbi:DUF2254 domain-containing protein [Aquipuribacter sp. SD81]|uniref:DUF2254 domain-containing protein n=1 Tax=Aquipuribacter sp. SD81 TaxID=3127703 RepID=UPI00301ADC2B
MTFLTRMRESFWVLPAALCLLAAAAAQGLIEVDRSLVGTSTEPLVGVDVLYRVGADGSRTLLSAIAGSVLGVASTTFSITIAVMALTSSSFGPRLVRNFMADRGNQVVLGTYLATFLYSLLVLRAIRTLDGTAAEEPFVPHLAVNGAVVLAVASIGLLVWFIHHISDSIQVWTLARRVREDLRHAVDDLYPARSGAGPAPRAAEGPEGPVSLKVRAAGTGYVVGVDVDDLVATAAELDLVMVLRVRPGDFVAEEGVVADVHGDVPDAAALAARIRRQLSLSAVRSPAQDVGFSVQLLLDMLARALSPGTNDPYTARTALDDLSDGLAALARRDHPEERRVDEDGVLRVVAPSVGLIELVDTVVDTVRAYGLDHPDVVVRAVRLLGQVAEDARPEQVTALVDQLDTLLAHHATTDPFPRDRERVLAAADAVRPVLPAPPAL